MDQPIISDIKTSAEFAVIAAKKRFGQTLDFSENSLQQLDILLEQAYQQFSCLEKEGKVIEEAANRTATIWGSYLGEVIRINLGGVWSTNVDEKKLIVSGQHLSPITYVFQRIALGFDHTAVQYYSAVKMIVGSSLNRHSETQTEFRTNENNQQSTRNEKKRGEDFTDKTKSPTKGIATKAIVTFAGIFFVLLATILLTNRDKYPKEFRANLNTLLVEGEKITVMTEQGVSNSDFRNQLVEVRSAYKILSGTWPSSLENERTLFDKAVAGWILTLDIWDYKLDPGVFSFEDLLLERAKNYSGYNYESANLIMIDQWIGIIMGLAGQYFSDGKASISEKID